MCKTSIRSPSCRRNIIIQIKLVLREFHTISTGHTRRKPLFVRSSLAKEGFNLVLTTRNRRQPSLLCRKFEIYLPEISQRSVIFSRSFIDHLTFRTLVYSFFYICVTTKAHAYKFVTFRAGSHFDISISKS